MWQRFKASFNSREHMRDFLWAAGASVMCALCVGAVLVAILL